MSGQVRRVAAGIGGARGIGSARLESPTGPDGRAVCSSGNGERGGEGKMCRAKDSAARLV